MILSLPEIVNMNQLPNIFCLQLVGWLLIVKNNHTWLNKNYLNSGNYRKDSEFGKTPNV